VALEPQEGGDSVGGGGIGNPFAGRWGKVPRAKLALVHQAQPVIPVVLDDVHLGADWVEYPAGLIAAAEPAQGQVSPVRRGDEHVVVVVREALALREGTLGILVLATQVSHQPEVVVDVGVVCAAREVLLVGRAVGLDGVRPVLDQCRGPGEVRERFVEASEGDVPVAAVAQQPVAVRMTLHPVREDVDRFLITPKVRDSTPEPDRPLLIARFLGERPPRLVELRLQSHTGRRLYRLFEQRLPQQGRRGPRIGVRGRQRGAVPLATAQRYADRDPDGPAGHHPSKRRSPEIH
jgi:hypothetical protein